MSGALRLSERDPPADAPQPTALRAEVTAMFAEAAEAAAVVRAQLQTNEDRIAALAARLRASPPRLVATLGRGSSDHAATYARYLIETRPSPELMHELLARADDASTVWGDVVPPAAREHATRMCARRLAIAGLTGTRAAA